MTKTKEIIADFKSKSDPQPLHINEDCVERVSENKDHMYDKSGILKCLI